MEAIDIMGPITSAVTLLMFMTGIHPVLQMYRTKSTKNVPYPIFLLAAICCTGTLHYGVMMDNGTITFLNAVGAVLQWSYVLLYLIFIEDKSGPLMYLFAGLCYMAGLYFYMYRVLVDEMSIAEMIGSSSSMLTTALMCLPCYEIVNNLRYKNADGMPPVMIAGGTACSFCWLIFGLMLNDPNVYYPNIPGLMVNAAKIYIIFVYSDTQKERLQ